MSSLIYLFLCLSLHACSARHLNFRDKETGKGLVTEKLERTSSAMHLSSSNYKEFQQQENYISQNGKRKTLGSWATANARNHKDSKSLQKEEKNKGKEIKVSLPPEVLQETIKIQESKRHERSILGSATHDTAESVNSKENDVVEDVVVMDYAQPHRKPPIHNKKD